MNQGRTGFAQLLDLLPQYELDQCVACYRGNFRVRKLPTYEQFLVLALAQPTWRESLWDIETCRASFGPGLYHSGISQPTARSTLADANEKRDWRIFADFAQVLIQQATTLYGHDLIGGELRAAAYAWRTNHFAAAVTNADLSGDAADPDNDSVANLDAFYYALAPKITDANTGHVPAVGPDDNDPRLQFIRRQDSGTAALICEFSTDLHQWNFGRAGVDYDDFRATPNGDGPESVSFRLFASEAPRFVRFHKAIEP